MSIQTLDTSVHHDADFDAFLARIQARFLANTAGGAVFVTDAEGLFDAYLDALPQEDRQYHTCHACRQFVERFGGLVTIAADGSTAPAVWHEDDAPEFYRPAIAAMARLVRRAKVTGAFLSSETAWGQHETGPWHHFAVTPPAAMVYRRTIKTAGQAMAEKREDFKTVMHALNEFTQPMIEQALTLLRSDAMYRGEKVVGPAQWLYDLHVARTAAHGSGKANVVWRAIAAAPAGFCHPRASMIGTLLEDIAAGLDFGDVSRRFAAKMHPLQYQRPQADPSAGNIAQAEKIVEQLGIARSLARRFARLDEIQALWKPTAQKPDPAGGIFGHLKPKEAAPSMTIPAQTMTWDKFSRTVLADATQIELMVPPGRANFAALVTAEYADAPPIIQWDSEDQRNPVSCYVYHGGSPASSWGLSAGAWTPVTAVSLQPPMWFGDRFPHQGKGALFILDGAKDSRDSGAALFPEILKAELRAIRSTIEAYSGSATMGGKEEASACGIAISGGQPCGVRLRVTTARGTRAEYLLDRWD